MNSIAPLRPRDLVVDRRGKWISDHSCGNDKYLSSDMSFQNPLKKQTFKFSMIEENEYMRRTLKDWEKIAVGEN